MKNKTILYFKCKQSPMNVFSSEIFDNNEQRAIFMRTSKNNIESSDNITFKEYHNINDVLQDESCIILTDDSFSISELKMIEDVIYAHGRHVYGDERVINIVHKIENMIMNKHYLPDDKTKIIRK